MFYLPVSTVTHTVKSVAQGRFQIAAKTEVALVWFWPRSYLVVVFICAHLPFFWFCLLLLILILRITVEHSRFHSPSEHRHSTKGGFPV